MRIDPDFLHLYESEFQAVFGAAYLLSGDRALAEDAAQEAFARCLERWSRLGDKPWVAGWVMTTALNHVRRSLRRRGTRTGSGDGTDPARRRPGQARSPAGRDRDSEIDLWRAIRSLPQRQQEAVVLHYAMDLPLGEVAAVMRCQEGTVKAHLARARESLRRHMEEQPHER